jgi:hypothetical protein
VSTRRLLLRTIVTGACLTAAVAIFVLLSGSLDGTSGRVLLTTTAISIFGVLAVPAQMLLDRGSLPLLARASGALTGAAFAVTLVLIWGDGGSTGWWKAWGIAATLALAAAQAAAVEARRRDSDSPAVRRLVALSMATGATLAVLGTLGILAEVSSGGYLRAIGVIGVIDLLSLVVAAALRRGEGSTALTHRIRVNGRLVEAQGRDFAAAVAAAIREEERQGTPVRRVERA